MPDARTAIAPPSARLHPRDPEARVLRAAAQLFARHGYAQVGVGDIAAAAGITVSALSRHAHDKQELLERAIAHGIDDLRATIDAADGFDTLVTTLATHGVQRRELTVLWERDSRHLPADDRRELRHRLHACAERIAATVPAARPADAELLGLALLAAAGSPGYHRPPLPRRETIAAITTLARRVATTDLTAAKAASHPSPLAAASENAGDRRDVLLDAATRLFGIHGYDAVSMDQLGAAAGMAGSSIYRHFPSKSALFLAALEREAERLHRALAEARDATSTPRATLARVVDGYVAILLDHPAVLRTLVAEASGLNQGQRRFVRDAQRRYVGAWQDLLALALPLEAKREASVRVHGALAVINHLARLAALRRRPAFRAELDLLATRALLGD